MLFHAIASRFITMLSRCEVQQRPAIQCPGRAYPGHPMPLQRNSHLGHCQAGSNFALPLRLKSARMYSVPSHCFATGRYPEACRTPGIPVPDRACPWSGNRSESQWKSLPGLSRCWKGRFAHPAPWMPGGGAHTRRSRRRSGSGESFWGRRTEGRRFPSCTP